MNSSIHIGTAIMLLLAEHEQCILLCTRSFTRLTSHSAGVLRLQYSVFRKTSLQCSPNAKAYHGLTYILCYSQRFHTKHCYYCLPTDLLQCSYCSHIQKTTNTSEEATQSLVDYYDLGSSSNNLWFVCSVFLLLAWFLLRGLWLKMEGRTYLSGWSYLFLILQYTSRILIMFTTRFLLTLTHHVLTPFTPLFCKSMNLVLCLLESFFKHFSQSAPLKG